MTHGGKCKAPVVQTSLASGGQGSGVKGEDQRWKHRECSGSEKQRDDTNRVKQAKHNCRTRGENRNFGMVDTLELEQK